VHCFAVTRREDGQSAVWQANEAVAGLHPGILQRPGRSERKTSLADASSGTYSLKEGGVFPLWVVNPKTKAPCEALLRIRSITPADP
jgi:hypothetical protein